MVRIILIAIFSLMFAGCSITAKTPNEITIDSDGDITIEQQDGDFCPPGQAKKGRC